MWRIAKTHDPLFPLVPMVVLSFLQASGPAWALDRCYQ